MKLEAYTKNQRTRDARKGIFRAYSGNCYKVTGRTTDGRRFRILTESAFFALGINLYSGSKWVQYPDEPGKWRRFCQV